MINHIVPRDEKGRFLAWLCEDLNCCGVLMLDGGWRGPEWRCDGLTHDGNGGQLVACARSYTASTIAATVTSNHPREVGK